jgi:hypothetical protein
VNLLAGKPVKSAMKRAKLVNNPYDTPPEVDDDDQRPEEPDRRLPLTQLGGITLMLIAIAFGFRGEITEGSYAFAMAAVILIYGRVVGDW